MTTETMTVDDFFSELQSEINKEPFQIPTPKSEEVSEEVKEQKTDEVPIDVDIDLNSLSEESTDDEQEEEQQEEVREQETTNNVTASLKSQLLRATAELLQEQFKIPKEELDLSQLSEEDWTEETFQELVNELASYGAETKYSNYKNSNEEIAAVLEILEKGGNISLLDSYRDRRAMVEGIDTSTPSGKIDKIKAYYKQVEGKDNDWIENYLEFIQSKGTVDKELQTVETQYEAKFAAERQEIVEKQQKYFERKQAHEKALTQQFSQILETEKLKTDDKNELMNFVFNKGGVKLQSTGEVMSKFEFRLLEVRNKPEELYELSKFLMNKEKYIQEIVTKHNNQKVENKFSKLFSGTKTPTKEVKKQNNTTASKFQFFND